MKTERRIWEALIAFAQAQLAQLDSPKAGTDSGKRAMTGTERSRRCRAAKKAAAATATATALQRGCNVANDVAVASGASLSSSDQKAEPEQKKEEFLTLICSSSGSSKTEKSRANATRNGNGNVATAPDATVQRVATKRAEKKAAPIPADWRPTAEHRAFAKEHGLDVELEAYGFRGYWDGQSVKSPNGRFATWLSNSADRRRARGGLQQPMRAVDGPRGAAYRVVQPPGRQKAEA